LEHPHHLLSSSWVEERLVVEPPVPLVRLAVHAPLAAEQKGADPPPPDRDHARPLVTRVRGFDDRDKSGLCRPLRHGDGPGRRVARTRPLESPHDDAHDLHVGSVGEPPDPLPKPLDRVRRDEVRLLEVEPHPPVWGDVRGRAHIARSSAVIASRCAVTWSRTASSGVRSFSTSSGADPSVSSRTEGSIPRYRGSTFPWPTAFRPPTWGRSAHRSSPAPRPASSSVFG